MRTPEWVPEDKSSEEDIIYEKMRGKAIFGNIRKQRFVLSSVEKPFKTVSQSRFCYLKCFKKTKFFYNLMF